MLFILLIAVTPLWILDLSMRVLHLAPPAWLGDAMAYSLMFAAALLAHSAWTKRLTHRRTRHSAKPAATGEAWRESLPCLVHEIRNYASILKGNAYLLRSRMVEDRVLEPLGRLERTTHKIEALAQEILESASLSHIDRSESLCVHALLDTCIADHFHETRGSFRIDVEGKLPAVAGDARKLERVFLNLFKNAREAGAATIRIRLVPVRDRLRMLVEDDGHGCPPDAMAKLFRPLFTTKKGIGGTGLGLYMVKTIMEGHGGLVRAVSKNSWAGSQTGMIFCLELPVLKRPDKEDVATESQEGPIPTEDIAG